jgi:hypothetical protein
MSAMTKTHGVPTILAATAAALLLAACGGGSGGDGTSAGKSSDAKLHAFAECMRKGGVSVKEDSNGGIQMQTGAGISPSKVETIQRDCTRKTGGGPGGGKKPSKAEQAKFLDQALKFAQCMRSHGVNVPDPQASGGGIIMKMRAGGGGSNSSGGGIDPKGPAFQSAQKECGRFMPGGKGAPGLSSQSAGKDGGSGGSLSLEQAP